MNNMPFGVSSLSLSTAGNSATTSPRGSTSQPSANGLPPLPLESESNQLASLIALPISLVLLRHGDSIASRMGRICCDPTIGRIESGLVGSGLLQVRNSIIEAKDAGILDKNTVIITSPFLRTKESAHIAASLLSARSPLEDDRASERNFGSLNGQSAERYEEVWLQDLSSQGPITYESAPAVMERMTGLVLELCQKYEGETVLLVSHGDPLNILSCALARHSASGHRQLGPLKLGELRPVELVPPRISIDATATYVS